MKNFSYTVKDKNGIHARPAGGLCKTAGAFKSNIKLVKGNKSADCKGLFSVLGLGVKFGDAVIVEIEGEDEEIAEKTIKEFMESRL